MMEKGVDLIVMNFIVDHIIILLIITSEIK